MKNYKIEEWKDYWNVFDDLISSLKEKNKENIVLEFKNSQKYLNGMTDGWYDFLNAFNKTLKEHTNHLTNEQIDIANFLVATLENSLKNR